VASDSYPGGRFKICQVQSVVWRFAIVPLTIIDVTIEGDIPWGTVTVHTTRQAPPPPRDNYWVRIENTTNVVVDIWARVENAAAPVGLRAGMYAAVTGPDNQIENVDWWQNPALTLNETNIASTTWVRIPWMQDILPPGANPPIYRFAFPALDTSHNQVSSSYRGRLYLRAVENGTLP
jgi:hypothetical protein